MSQMFAAGAATADITPAGPVFLFGYPHVKRMSTGVHDPLLSSALYVWDGRTAVIFVASDVIYVGKASAARARERIARLTGVPAQNVMLTATHTHSGPVTVDCLFCEADPAVPRADAAYVAQLEDGIVQAAVRAAQSAVPAEIGLAVADASGIGTHRRDPGGPSEPAVPVLSVRAAGGGRAIALMLVCSMHPTVLHEDSTLITGDFPAACRRHLQGRAVAADCPVLHHTGPCGNQSPRHVVRGQTFAECERIGGVLGRAVERAMTEIRHRREAAISCASATVDLPVRRFPALREAERILEEAVVRLARLRAGNSPPQEVRTAEVDWFGAEELVTWSRAAETGRIREAVAACLPAEVQVVRIGEWKFVGWPGEVFVEYGLEVRRRDERAFVMSMANGELQGYIVTETAATENWYEANIALFAPAAGRILVDTAVDLLGSG